MDNRPGAPRRVSDDLILRFLRKTDEHHVSTSEIIDLNEQVLDDEKITLGHEQLSNRLKELRDEGEICHKKAGRTDTWWIEED